MELFLVLNGMTVETPKTVLICTNKRQVLVQCSVLPVCRFLEVLETINYLTPQ